MMSAALQTTLTPTPHLAVLHQQRLYIVSALQRTHIVLDGVRARLNNIENTLAGDRRHCSTTETIILLHLDSADTPSCASSPNPRSSTPPESPASHTADDQPGDDSANANQDEQNRLSRATRKKLQHNRWRARGTLRNCVAEERALLENLHTIQDRILRLQEDALRDSAFAASTPVAMTQTEFCNTPWTSGWTVEFGEKTAQLGCGFGPSDVPRKTSFGAPPGGAIRGSIDAALRQAAGLNPNSWMNGSGVSHSGNTVPIINAQIIPLHQPHPQLQLNTPCNQVQFPSQFQLPFQQPFIYSPAITSPLLLDSETTAEDLYAWQNGDADAIGNPYGCVDPSSVFYNADPYHSFSYSSNGSFSYPTPSMSQEHQHQPNDSQDTQYATANNDDAQQQSNCLSPFPEEWDLAQALRVGRSGSTGNDDDDKNPSSPGKPGGGRRRHVRQLSALLSPRGSRVYHIDDLVPHISPGGPKSAAADRPPTAASHSSRKPSAVVIQTDVGRDMGFGGWLQDAAAAAAAPPTTTAAAAANKGKGKALDPTSPTFVPGAAFFCNTKVFDGDAVMGGAGAGEGHNRTGSVVVIAAPSEESSTASSSFSNGMADSVGGMAAATTATTTMGGLGIVAAGAGAEKRRFSGYSSAAVDLLLNRFKENAANPIKKRRSWKRGGGKGAATGTAGGGKDGAAAQGVRGLDSVGEGAEEIQLMMQVV